MGTRLCRNLDGSALELRRFHLAGQCPDPDELIKPRLFRIEHPRDLLGMAAHIGWTDGLMRFLSVLLFRRVAAGRSRHVISAELRTNNTARRRDCLGCHVDTVGSHIGDQADCFATNINAFIETLRDLHRAGGGKPELAAGFLLQGRGCEGRVGMALGRFGLHRGDREGGRVQIALERFCCFAVSDIETRDFFTICANEPCLEIRILLRREQGGERPIFVFDEGVDLAFAVTHDPECDGLNAAGRACARQFTPQHGREPEADEVIKGAAREIGIDKGLVDLTRMGHRIEDGIFRDRVEGDAFDGNAFERTAGIEGFDNMP